MRSRHTRRNRNCSGASIVEACIVRSPVYDSSSTSLSIRSSASTAVHSRRMRTASRRISSTATGAKIEANSSKRQLITAAPTRQAPIFNGSRTALPNRPRMPQPMPSMP